MGRPLKEYTPEDYREIWALNFRKLRTRKFDNQDEFVLALAHQGLEVTKGTVSHWERGFRLPSIEHLPVIAAALGCQIARLTPKYEFSPADR